MLNSATHLTQASEALAAIHSEADLMTWHDLWMCSDDYTAMADDDAHALEVLFQRQSALHAGPGLPR